MKVSESTSTPSNMFKHCEIFNVHNKKQVQVMKFIFRNRIQDLKPTLIASSISVTLNGVYAIRTSQRVQVQLRKEFTCTRGHVELTCTLRGGRGFRVEMEMQISGRHPTSTILATLERLLSVALRAVHQRVRLFRWSN